MNSSTMSAKLDKAHYGLKQVSKAWYETLSTYLIEHNFVRGLDLNGKDINESQYRGMIGSVMNLTASRPDIQFSIDLYARYQANIKNPTLFLLRIFRCNMDIKSTSDACQFLKASLFAEIKNHTLKRDIEFHFIPTQYQLADIFTKPLDEPTFKRLIVELGGIRGDIGITTFWNALRAHYLSHSSMYVPPPSITIVRPWFAPIGYSGEIRAKGTLKKSCLPPRWRLLMGQIIQFLGGKTSGLDQISNKDATIFYCLANGVKVDYAKLIWEDIIHKLNKKTREKVVLYPRFISLLLEYMMPAYDNEELTTNPTQVFNVHN
ncbi:hypothetical protein Tco_0579263 [Tanacetum coccineum]